MTQAGRPRIALWHNLPSGGGKRALMEQVKRLSKTCDIDLYTTSLVDDSFCPIEPYCNTVHTFSVRENPYKGWKAIKVRWKQGTDMYRIAQESGTQINQGGYDAAYVASCQIEHTPTVLRLLTGNRVYFCQEGLRTYYEPQPPLEGIKDVVGRLLKQPELLRRMWRDRMAMKSGAQILVNSKTTQQTIARWYGVESTICYPGVDTKIFFPPQQPVLSSERETFFSVGRLSHLKGHDFVIEVLGHLPPKYRVLTIAYDQEGPAEQRRLTQLAAQKGVTLHLKHRIPEKALREFYQSAWAVMCGQRREPFGLIPIEAMACGGFVCAVAEGGFRETIQDGTTGILVERNPGAAAVKLKKFLDNEQAQEKIRVQGAACVREEWSWEKHCERLLHYLLS